ncbi:MAG TPA: branched-chain amino acid ABC transporter substrate-binding protein, partial [Rhodospirillales bacterium]|nr:branched-chain amino acid ABC transporter substrate-binding protein [Rhodospirillales bacterium]
MKKLLLAMFLLTPIMAPSVVAGKDIKIGVILGFTGTIESLTPDMDKSAELAFKEASDSGLLQGGKKIEA